MLAIAAQRFSTTSETFILNHVRTIAPGETILLCEDGTEADLLGCPVLSHMSRWTPPQTLGERTVNAIEHRWRTFIDPNFHSTDDERVDAFLRAHYATAVLAEYGSNAVLLSKACRGAGVPLYAHFHGIDASMLLKQWCWRRAYQSLFRTIAGVIAPSRFLLSKLSALGCPEDKQHISPYGVDAAYFLPSCHTSQRIVTVGRLVEKKAPDLTLEAFGRIAKKYPQARLDMVGGGPLAERCERVVRDLGIASQVQMHGTCGPEMISRLMGESSIFVLHSVTAANGDIEGLPVAILEAMASELPVVSTQHSGIPEAVADGITGILVEERDVEGMARAMTTLIESPERAISMGKAGRERVLKEFTLERSRDRLRTIMKFPPFEGPSNSRKNVVPARVSTQSN